MKLPCAVTPLCARYRHGELPSSQVSSRRRQTDRKMVGAVAGKYTPWHLKLVAENSSNPPGRQKRYRSRQIRSVPHGRSRQMHHPFHGIANRRRLRRRNSYVQTASPRQVARRWPSGKLVPRFPPFGALFTRARRGPVAAGAIGDGDDDDLLRPYRRELWR